MGFRLSGGGVAQGHVAGPRGVGEGFAIDRDFLVSFGGRGVGNRDYEARGCIEGVKLAGAASSASGGPAPGLSRRCAGRRRGLLRGGGAAGSTVAALAPGNGRQADHDHQQDLSVPYESHCESLLARYFAAGHGCYCTHIAAFDLKGLERFTAEARRRGGKTSRGGKT